MKPWPDKWKIVRLKRWLETFWVLSKKLGHFESAWKGTPYIDGKPVPWINYSALEFLDLVTPKAGKVFEYGVGGSTLWFLNRGLRVNAVESRNDWATKISSLANWSPQLSIRTQEDLSKYPGEYRLIPGGGDRYGLVFIDGEITGNTRLKCLFEAKRMISSDGIIVVDNIDWLFRTWREAILDREFLCIPVSGFTPLVPYTTTCLFMFQDHETLRDRLGCNGAGIPAPRGGLVQNLEI